MADRDPTAIDMKDVELRDMMEDEEKVPMTAVVGGGGGGDANGAVSKLDAASGDANAGETTAARFTGLSKDELLKISVQPFWVRTRLALLVLFWLGWLAMLAGAVAIIVQAPRCKPEPARDWWQMTAVYEISTRSFSDKSGDGFGDIQGLQERLDYLKQLNVRAMVLQLIPEDAAATRQETNITNVDTRYGQLAELQKLLTEARRKDIKIIMDMFPATWFNGTDRTEMRVKMKEALTFWMKQGIAGFRIGVDGLGSKEDVNLLFEEWHNTTSGYTEDKVPRVLIADAREDSDLAESVVQSGHADLPIVYDLRKLSVNATAKDVSSLVDSVFAKAANKSIAWGIGGHNGYSATKNQEWNRALGILMLTLPGTPFIYYGDEIGLRDFEGSEVPMPWDDSSGSAGFSSAMPWKPLNPNYKTVNVKSQETHKDNSTLLLYRSLAKLKWSESAGKFGDFQKLNLGQGLYGFQLVWDQSPRLVVLLNLNSNEQTLDLVKEHELPAKASVIGSSTLDRSGDVDLTKLHLKALEAVVLKYNHVA